MSPELEKSINLLLKKLERVRDRELPVRVGRAVVNGIRDNFNRGGFYGRPWKTPIRSKAGFRGATGPYGPLLSGTNHLRDSTDYIPGTGRVAIRNTAHYAGTHNEGADIAVTVKMKKFFWAKHYEAAGDVPVLKSGRQSRSRKADSIRGEAAFWRNMALKRTGSRIKIPQRKFMGESPEVGKAVEAETMKALQRIIDNIK